MTARRDLTAPGIVVAPTSGSNFERWISKRSIERRSRGSVGDLLGLVMEQFVDRGGAVIETGVDGPSNRLAQRIRASVYHR